MDNPLHSTVLCACGAVLCMMWWVSSIANRIVSKTTFSVLHATAGESLVYEAVQAIYLPLAADPEARDGVMWQSGAVSPAPCIRMQEDKPGFSVHDGVRTKPYWHVPSVEVGRRYCSPDLQQICDSSLCQCPSRDKAPSLVEGSSHRAR